MSTSRLAWLGLACLVSSACTVVMQQPPEEQEPAPRVSQPRPAPPPARSVPTLGISPAYFPMAGSCRVWVERYSPSRQARGRACAGILETAPPGALILYRPAQYERQLRVRYLHRTEHDQVVAVRVFDAETGAFLHDLALADDDDNMRVAPPVVRRPAPVRRPPADPRPDPSVPTLGIATRYLPPAGSCRVWIQGRSASRQARARPCPGILETAQPGGWILYRPAQQPRHIRVRYLHQRQRDQVVAVRVFDAQTGAYLQDLSLRYDDDNMRVGPPVVQRPTPVRPPVDDRRDPPNNVPTLGIPTGQLPPAGACRIWIQGTPTARQARSRPCAGILSRAQPGAWILYRPAQYQRQIRVRYLHQRQRDRVVAVRVFDAQTGAYLHDLALNEDDDNMRIAPPDVERPQDNPPRDPPSNAPRLGVPTGHLPPAGACRVWIEGTPAGRQARSRPCAGILSAARPGSWILYRPAHSQHQIRVRYLHQRQQGRVVAVRVFDAQSGRYLQDLAPSDDDDNMSIASRDTPPPPPVQRPPENPRRDPPQITPPPVRDPRGRTPPGRDNVGNQGNGNGSDNGGGRVRVDNPGTPDSVRGNGNANGRGNANGQGNDNGNGQANGNGNGRRNTPDQNAGSGSANGTGGSAAGAGRQSLTVDASNFPRAGQCRVWIPGRNIRQQARPRGCNRIEARAPAGAWILRRPRDQPNVILVDFIDGAEGGVIAKTYAYDAASGAFMREVQAR